MAKKQEGGERGGGGLNQISILSKLLKDSFVMKTAEARLWPVLGFIEESDSENRVIFQHVSRLRLTMLTARLRPFDCYAQKRSRCIVLLARTVRVWPCYQFLPSLSRVLGCSMM